MSGEETNDITEVIVPKGAIEPSPQKLLK